jgi:molybdenum cofactor cytidylyltransferase
MTAVSAILLAAGESRRMGVNKLSLPWGRRTVVEQCLHTLLKSEVKEVVVVLGALTKDLGNRLGQPGVKVVFNPHSRKGMGTSIRRGLRAVDRRCRGVLIALGDQPCVKTKTINALIRAFGRQRSTIVVPTFKGQRGHPVLFDRRFENELRNLKRDVGGRSLLEQYGDCLAEVRVRSEGILKDVDTWEEYRKGLQSRGRR